LPTFRRPAAVIQAACTSYYIDRNIGGYRTKIGKVVTFPSGASTLNVTAGTQTGFASTSPIGLTGVTLFPLSDPISGIRYWITTNSQTSFDIKSSANPGTAVDFRVEIDTSRKPVDTY
jgi:hypothetical protein